jgi:rhodanese-related sulfurtransferase
MRIIIGLTCFLLLTFNSIAIETSSQEVKNNSAFAQSVLNEYIDITVDEAWVLLNDTTNGIQFPIDVRSDNEWKEEHINTPYPEYPHHHNFREWDNIEILSNFLSTYQGNEIIIYCRSGGRSVSAANILIENNFQGTIYNMLGGITEWKLKGYPIVPNRPPFNPEIQGPSIGQPGIEYNFSVISYDADYDLLQYYVNWSNVDNEEYLGTFESGEEIILRHSWQTKGLHYLKIKTIDPYLVESEWTIFEIDISATELEIIDLRTGLGSVIIDIKNIGENTAEEIQSIIYVTGGILSNINLTHTCSGCSNCGTSLESNAVKTENTRESGYVFGFGSIYITANTWARNAEMASVTKTGFIFGVLISLN